MPAAIIPAAIGAAGSIGSSAGGKKAQNRANNLAQQQLGLEKQLIGSGIGATQPAQNWYRSLLGGGQAAVQATGPVAQQIGQAYQGARNQIAATTPRGGEANLATQQSFVNQAGDIGRLYAGMQPAAAGALGQLGGQFLGAGQGLAFPSTIGGLGASQMAMQNAQLGATGFGGLLYNSLNKLRGGGGGGKAPASVAYGAGGGYGAPPTGFGIGA